MSAPSNENEMDTPATRRELYDVRDELLRKIHEVAQDVARDLAHQMRGMEESIIAHVSALLDPYRDLPARMGKAEGRLDALERPPTPPRRARRRSR